MAVFFFATSERKEFFLEFTRDGTGDAFADLNVIHTANRRDFDCGADEEYFIHDVKHFARDDGFLHFNAEILRHFHYCVARDAGENAGGERRGVEHAVVREENVHAGALADVAVGIERNAFRVAVELRFHANELRVHVIRGGFGHRRKSVRSNAGPRADADVHAFGEGFGTEIRAPGPTSHVAIDG